MTAIEIALERETANDETAIVTAVYVQSGTVVEKDDVLFDFENSKATQEVVAPETGVLSHELTKGAEVEFGVCIARVTPVAVWSGVAAEPAVPAPAVLALEPVIAAAATAPPEPAPPEPAPASRPMPAESRFSAAAAALIAKLGLSRASFDLDFVTTRDVNAAAGLTPPVTARPTRTPAPVATHRGSGTPLDGRKRAEIDALSNGAGSTMLSVLGTLLGPLPVPREAGAFLTGRITDVVIYEAARLMRSYPKLNGYFADGSVYLHESVHAGMAIDSGGKLVVYGIEHADSASLVGLSETMSDAVARYLDGTLTSAELSRATFTVTDLSDGELDFVLPLLPRGQSCILGITHSSKAGFRIDAGFDHRVSEGREVAAFLGELRARLLSFAVPAKAAVATCSYCDRPTAEAVGNDRGKALLKVVDRNGRDALCCASCWNGW